MARDVVTCVLCGLGLGLPWGPVVTCHGPRIQPGESKERKRQYRWRIEIFNNSDITLRWGLSTFQGLEECQFKILRIVMRDVGRGPRCSRSTEECGHTLAALTRTVLGLHVTFKLWYHCPAVTDLQQMILLNFYFVVILSLKNFLTVGTAGPNFWKVSTCLLIQPGSWLMMAGREYLQLKN